MSRKTCPVCEIRPVAIAYHRNGKTYYRNRCDTCIRARKQIKPKPAGWIKSGYKKKPHCEKCGFKAKHKEQLTVVYVDGNTTNIDWFNLKTICLNCEAEIKHIGVAWKPSGLVPDL